MKGTAAANTKERILDAALRLFNTEGTPEITTNRIAEEAGISPGNLYYYYKNKEEITRSLVKEMIGTADKVWLAEDGSISPAHELDKLTGLIELMFLFFNKYTFFFNDFNYIMKRDPNLADDFREMVAARQKITEDMIEKLSAAGLIRSIPPDEHELLVHNSWIVSSNWLSYAAFMWPGDSQKALKQGVLQVLSSLLPYATPLGKETLLGLMDSTMKRLAGSG